MIIILVLLIISLICSFLSPDKSLSEKIFNTTFLLSASVVLVVGLSEYFPEKKDVFYLEQLHVDKISGESLKKFYLTVGNIGSPGKLGYSFRYEYNGEKTAGTIPLKDAEIVEITDPSKARLEIGSGSFFVSWYGISLQKMNVFYIPKN